MERPQGEAIFSGKILTKEWVKTLCAAGVLAIAIGTALFPLFMGRVIYETDVIYYYLPAFKFYSDALHSGTSFLIAPIFSGFPLLLTQVGGFLDPLNLLIFKALPFLAAYNIRITLNYFLAGILTYLFARSLKLTFTASLLAAFAYITAQNIIPGANILRSNSFFLMPGLFLVLQQLSMYIPAKRTWTSVLYGIGGITLLTISFLGGYTQLCLYSLVAAVLFAAYLLYLHFSIRLAAAFAAVFVSAGALLAPYISSVLALAQVSHRAGGLSWFEASRGISFTDYLHTLSINLFLPIAGTTGTLQSLYIGTISVFFFIYALTLIKVHTRVVFFAGLVAFSVLSAFPYPLFFGMHLLPIFSFFRFPPHWFFVTSFAMSILAGLGLHHMCTTEKSSLYAYAHKVIHSRAWLICAVALLALNFIVPMRITLAKTSETFEDLLPPPWVVKTINEQSSVDAFRTYQLYSDTTFAIYSNLFQPNIFETKRFEQEFTQTHLLPLLWNQDTVLGFDALEPSRYMEVLDFLEKPIYKDTIVADNVPPAESFVRMPSQTFYVLGMMNVKYFWALSSLDKVNDADATLVGSTTFAHKILDIHLYENKHFLPRIFAPASVEVLKENDHAFDRIIKEPHNFGQISFIECSSCELGMFEAGTVTATDVVVKNELISFTSKATKPSWLVVSNAMVPGWEATIDGTPTELHYANYLYQGILIPAGEHMVVIRYIPPYNAFFPS